MSFDEERCQRCGEMGHDRRTLWMSCFYDMTELGLPFEPHTLFNCKREELQVTEPPKTITAFGRSITLEPAMFRCSGELWPLLLHTLRVCKDCRADWLKAIKTWFTTSAGQVATGTGVFVRENGGTRELTRAEVLERWPNHKFGDE